MPHVVENMGESRAVCRWSHSPLAAGNSHMTRPRSSRWGSIVSITPGSTDRRYNQWRMSDFYRDPTTCKCNYALTKHQTRGQECHTVQLGPIRPVDRPTITSIGYQWTMVAASLPARFTQTPCKPNPLAAPGRIHETTEATATQISRGSIDRTGKKVAAACPSGVVV
jgi:hypothetical protein